MENAPSIILFWCFIIAIFIMMITLVILAFILIKKGKGHSNEKMLFLGKICFTLSVICSLPIILVIGYILYIYIAVTIY